MATPDIEIDEIKQSVSCATLLERSGGWQVDQASSTRAAVKYRRGAGEIIIVNHEGRGWWDPQGNAKGDVFSLAQHLDPQLTFGGARKMLRGLAGIAPTYPAATLSVAAGARAKGGNGAAKQPDEKPLEPVAVRWNKRPSINPGSSAWRYLSEMRGLPDAVLRAASAQDALREGPYASAWFVYRDMTGTPVGFESRGPEFKGFSKGGDKTLFQFKPGSAPPSRIAVAEGAIDALSLAALERSKTDGSFRADTLYVATGGGIGPYTEVALQSLLDQISGNPGARLTAATDND